MVQQLHPPANLCIPSIQSSPCLAYIHALRAAVVTLGLFPVYITFFPHPHVLIIPLNSISSVCLSSLLFVHAIYLHRRVSVLVLPTLVPTVYSRHIPDYPRRLSYRWGLVFDQLWPKMADNKKDEVSETVSGGPTQKEQEQEVEKLGERCVG